MAESDSGNTETDAQEDELQAALLELDLASNEAELHPEDEAVTEAFLAAHARYEAALSQSKIS